MSLGRTRSADCVGVTRTTTAWNATGACATCRRSHRLGTSRGSSLASHHHRYGHLHGAKKPPCATNRRKVSAYVAERTFARVTSQGRACDALQSLYAACAWPGITCVGEIPRRKNRHGGTPRRTLWKNRPLPIPWARTPRLRSTRWTATAAATPRPCSPVVAAMCLR